MQNTFKVGDKVCQKDADSIQTSDGSYLYKSKDLIGKVLTITEVDDSYVYFNKQKENVPHDVYCWERFELVEDKKQPQQTYKIGDKVKVVKLNTFVCKEYESFIGEVVTVTCVLSRGVSTTSPSTAFSGLFFYNEEIELVEDTPVQEKQEVATKQQKTHAWAVVNKSTGKVEWIRQTRSVARKLAQFQNETSTHLYQVKKIEYNFV